MASDNIKDSPKEIKVAQVTGPDFGEILADPRQSKPQAVETVNKPAAKVEEAHKGGNLGEATSPPPEKSAPEKAKPVEQAAEKESQQPAAAGDAEKLKAALGLAKEASTEVKAASHQGDLAQAQAGYEKAIALSKQITDEQVLLAKNEMEQIGQAKSKETDTTKLQALTARELELLALTRMKDITQGNMALWYYRNGKVEEGTQKLLEAAGLDPQTAVRLKKMDKEAQIDAVGQINPNAPILTDVNFMRAYDSLRQQHQEMPEIFSQIHRDILEKKQAKPNPTQPVEKTEVAQDKGAVSAERIQELARQAKDPANAQALKDYDSTMQAVASKAGKATDDELKKLEAGTKVADLSYEVGKAQVDFLAQNLERLVPTEKRSVFNEGTGLINGALDTMIKAGTVDGKPAVKADDKKNLDLLASGEASAEDKARASEQLGKAYPDFAGGVAKIQEATGSQENGQKALTIFLMGSRLESATDSAAFAKVKHHFETAEVFNFNGNKEKAKEILQSGLEGVPPELKANLLKGNPDVAKLAQDLGLAQTEAQTSQPEPVAILKGKYPELAKLSEKELANSIKENTEKGPEGLEANKKAYEEIITRLSTPEYVDALKKDLNDNVKVLESGKAENGQALTSEERLAYHRANLDAVDKLKLLSSIQLEYAEYLGSKDIFDAKLPTSEKPGEIQPAWKSGSLAQNKSMDFWAREAIKTADALPVDLMKREQAQLEADLAKGVNDPNNLLTKGLDYLKGTKGHHGVMDSAVDLRVQLGTLYIQQGVKISADGQRLEQNPSSRKDELYKPDEALKLMDEAIAKNKEIYGAGNANSSITDLRTMLNVVEPEKMQKLADGYKREIQSSHANMGAAVVSVATQALGEIVLPILTKGKMKPGMVQATTAGLNLVDTSLARSALMRWQTGETESLADTMANSAAVTGTVLATRHVSRFAMDKLAQSQTMAVFNRAIDDLRLPPTTTMDEVAERLVQNKTLKDVEALSQFSGKTLGEVRGDSAELAKFVNAVPELHGSSGLNSLIANQGKVQQLDVADSLKAKGINTVGDLESRLGGNLAILRRFVSDAEKAGIDLKKTSVEDAITKLHETVGGSYSSVPIANQKAMFDELGLQVQKVASKDGQGRAYSFYQGMRGTRDVNTMEDLSRYLSDATGKSELQRLYPDLAKQDGSLQLRDLARDGGVLANAQSSASSRALLERFAPGSMKGYNDVSFRTKLGEALWSDRFYSVPTQKNSIQSMTNREVASYANARLESAAVLGTFTGVSLYKNSTILYDDYLKGNPDGSKLTLNEALLKANFGSADAHFDSLSGIAKSTLLGSNLTTSILIGAPMKGFILGRPDASLSSKAQINNYLSKSSLFGSALSLTNAYTLFPNGDAEGLYSRYDALNQAAQMPLTDFNYSLGQAVPGSEPVPEPENKKAVEAKQPVKVEIPPPPVKPKEEKQPKPKNGLDVGPIDDLG